MTIGGWLTMLVSLALVWGMTFWAFKRVLSSPQEEHAPPGFGP